MDQVNEVSQDMPAGQPMETTAPVEPVTPQPPMGTPQSTPAPSSNYASFGKRFLALFIDVILVGVCVGVLSAVFGFSGTYGDVDYSRGLYSPFGLLGWAYYVFMVVKYGATVGKMAMHIRVQDEVTGQNLTVGMAILREIIGKFLSGIVLGLGYLWMLWDPKKQTWHDKLGKSIVVKAQ